MKPTDEASDYYESTRRQENLLFQQENGKSCDGRFFTQEFQAAPSFLHAAGF
jgi:hypothetical protein